MKLRDFLQESENRVSAYWSPDKKWSVRRRDNIGGDEWWTIFHDGTALPFGGKTYQEAMDKLKKEYKIDLAKGIAENKDEKQTQIAFDKAEKDINSEDPPKKNEEIDMDKYKTKSIIDGLEQTFDVQLKYQQDKSCIKVEDLKKVFAEYRKHMKV